MVGEFGGIGAFVTQWQTDKCHTYLKAPTPDEESGIYVNMIKSIIAHKQDILASVSTQITDVELECDGWTNERRECTFAMSIWYGHKDVLLYLQEHNSKALSARMVVQWQEWRARRGYGALETI